jgi:hypothetical protein
VRGADDQRGSHPEHAVGHIVTTTGVLGEANQGLDRRRAALMQQRPRIGESDPASVTAENACPELALEQVEPPAQRRGRGLHALRGRAKRARLGHGEERLEQPSVDRLGLS